MRPVAVRCVFPALLAALVAASAINAKRVEHRERALRTLNVEENDVLQRMQVAKDGRLPEPPQYMLDVYRKYSALADGVHRTIVAFFDRGGSNASASDAAEQKLTFDAVVPSVNDSTVTRIRSARMRLHLVERPRRRSTRYRIKVYVELENEKRLLCYSNTAVKQSRQWLQVEVGHCVDEWSQSEKVHQSIRFIVEAEQLDNELTPKPVRFSTGSLSPHTAMLILFEQDGSRRLTSQSHQSQTHFHGVAKRSTSKTNRRRTKKKDMCRKRALYVDFKDLGWDSWIIAPKGYKADYCAGECPYPLGQQFKPSTHAVVQTLLRHARRSSKVPPVCCVASELLPTSILYFDTDGSITFDQSYKDMIVGSCACR